MSMYPNNMCRRGDQRDNQEHNTSYGLRAQERNTGSEMKPEDTIAGNGRGGPKRRGLGLYFSLLSLQTGGGVILLVNMIPLYQLMALDFSNYRPHARPWWAIAGMLLIQVAYWVRVRLQPPLPRTRNIVLGHFVSFAAKLSFVIVASSFGLMFLTRFKDLRDMNYSPLRVLATLTILFSLFCWTLELERLAKVLQEDEHETSETHRD